MKIISPGSGALRVSVEHFFKKCPAILLQEIEGYGKDLVCNIKAIRIHSYLSFIYSKLVSL